MITFPPHIAREILALQIADPPVWIYPATLAR